MKHALMWLPPLAAFFLLAWLGYKEYQKVQAYSTWSQQFERAKYDIYAVMGQKDNNITWGKPRMKGPVDLKTFSLEDVQQIRLLIDRQAVEMASLPPKGRSIQLEFSFPEPKKDILIPFTEISLAVKWYEFLQMTLKNLPDSRLMNPDSPI